MAVSASTVWNIDTAGSSNNGGGFVTGATGTDFAVINTPVALTGVTSAGAGNVSLHANAADSWVGNIVNVVSGTNFTTTAGAARFEILSVVAGVSFTTGTNISGASISTGVGANGVMNIGGAVAFYNSATDDALLENTVIGNKWYIKKGSHSCGTFAVSVVGTAILHNIFEGYNSSYGDEPSIASGNQPVISLGANSVTFASFWELKYIQVTGTHTTNVSIGAGCRAWRCKFSNTSGSTNRPALALTGNNSIADECEITSTLGYAVTLGNISGNVTNCYIHDSSVGIREGGATTGMFNISGNIIDTMSTIGIDFGNGATTGILNIINNTLYGAATPAGSSTGFTFAASSGQITFTGNIVSGWVTGVTGTTIVTLYTDYNNFFNNTTARSTFATGTHDIALSSGFVDAPNGNFATGINVQRIGAPATFPGGLTPNYQDIGAAQSDQAGWYTDVGQTFVISTVGGYLYNSTANNRTAGYTAVGVSNVLAPIQYGIGLTGTYITVGISNVLKPVNYGVGLTGTYITVGISNVLSPVNYGVGLTGTYVTVSATNVLNTISYGLGITGTITLPTTGQVQDTVAFGSSQLLIGTYNPASSGGGMIENNMGNRSLG